VLTSGCTSWREYIENGFKVGPNYGKPPAPVAKDWIDADDQRVRKQSDDLSQWWTVFNDPVLDCGGFRLLSPAQSVSQRAVGLSGIQGGIA
jgi:hypothetical protein